MIFIIFVFYKELFNNKMLKKIIIPVLVIISGLVSCSPRTSKNINYLQNIAADTVLAMNVNNGIQIQSKDMISIIVSSRTPELSAVFNLSSASYQAGSEIAESNAGYQKLLGYVVDNEGCIIFPVLGKIQVSGLTRWELSEKIRNMLISNGLLNDPIITVEFMNFKISVIGEVNNPGTYNIVGDRINILQAISLAKDLTIYGKRDNVEVIREINGKRHIYHVDLRSADLFSSPAYNLMQNDVIYVEPNRVRAGQSTINENSFRSVSFWMSFGSFLTTIVNMIIIATRK
ncbi:MAG: polysaccharide biosynthesis/export family protein [Candidatus Cryptobacteroides sp.]